MDNRQKKATRVILLVAFGFAAVALACMLVIGIDVFGTAGIDRLTR